MKIAILVCGEYRWFNSFGKTFQNNFLPELQKHEVQYFTHFWDQDLEQLNNFTELCRPTTIQFEKKKSYSEVQQYFGINKPLTGSITNQAYGAHKSFLLLEQYKKEHNTSFDLYIKMRSDLAFLDTVNLNNFDNHSIYFKNIVHWRPLNHYLNDYIYFTKNYDALQKISELGFNLDHLIENPDNFIYQKDVSKNIYCPEEILANHTVDKKISTKTYSFNIDLARHHND